MSRAFNGTTDSLTIAAGSAPPDQGPITIVILAKAANTSGFTGWFARGRSGTTAIWSALTSNNAGAKLFMESDFGNGVAGLTTDWAYYVVTKAAGSNLPRWHTKNVTTNAAWAHTNNSANVGDNTGPIDNVFIGQSFPGSFAVVAAIAAEWNDATVEANCTYAATDLFNAVNASGWMVRLNQASTATSVTNDAAGGGNQTAISGTSIDATGTPDPPGYNYSISAGSTVAPSGIAIATALGQPTAVNSMDATSPGGIAIATARGNPTAVQTFTTTPAGIAAPVALGQPTAVNSMDTVTPTGLAIPTARGNPALVQTFTSTPSGIAVPATLGQPSVAQLAGAGIPAGISIPVALGTPTVAGPPYVPPTTTQGGWWQLEGLLDAARVIQRDERARQPVACPNDGEPLRVSIDGIVFCPYDNYIYGDRSRSAPRSNGGSGRDWGGLAGVVASAEADTFSAAILSASTCPNDGEPLTYSKDGITYCRFDGFRPDGGSMPTNPNL